MVMKQTRLKCVTLFFHPDKVKSRNCSSSSWGLLLAMTAPGRREFTHSLGKSQSKYGPESTSDSAIMKSNWWKMQFLPASLSSVKGLDSGSITELLFILLLPCLVRVYLDREEDTKICWDFLNYWFLEKHTSIIVGSNELSKSFQERSTDLMDRWRDLEEFCVLVDGTQVSGQHEIL